MFTPPVRPPATPPPTSCPSCGHKHPRLVGPLVPGAEFGGRILDMPLPGGALYTCPACYVSFRWPVPPKETLDALYQQAPPQTWQYDPSRRPDWQRTHRWLKAAYPDGGTLLDVGCFDGAFLDTLPPHWWRYGIEISEAAAVRARTRGVEMVAADVTDLRATDAAYDVVVAFDVLEHLPDPRRFLQQLVDCTRPGGAVIIGTGNTQALSWRLMGSFYWYCTIPEHLAFINDSWCQTVAPQLGLELLRLDHFSHALPHTLPFTLYEIATNLLYRLSPRLYGMLRAWGIGDKDVAEHPELKYAPPYWTTATDHLIAIFRKRCSKSDAS